MQSRIIQAEELANSNSVISMIMVANINDRNEYRKLRLGLPLADEFRRYIRQHLTQLKEQTENGQTSLLPYSAGYKPENHEVEYIDTNEDVYNLIRTTLNALPSLPSIAWFDKDETGFISKLTYYIIIMENQRGERVLLFRKYNSKKELSRSNEFAVFFNNGSYDKFQDKLFLFDEKVDCFLISNILFIENVHYFQLIFKFYEGLRNNADSILNDIQTRIPIANFDEFRTSCIGQLPMLSKLNNIANSPYFNVITMDDLKRTIQEFDLDISVTEENGSEELVYDRTDRWALLRLLDDDYLGSVMTEKRYMVNSKKII